MHPLDRRRFIPSFEDCSFHSSFLSRNCRRLRLYAVPLCGQDVVRSRRACFVTLARSHVFRIGFSTRTVCCGIEAQVPSQSGHGTTCISCGCWRNAFISPLDRDDTAGRFDLYLLPFRSSYGDVRGCYQLGLQYNTIYNTISFILEWTTSLDTSSRTVREDVCPRHVERRVTQLRQIVIERRVT